MTFTLRQANKLVDKINHHITTINTQPTCDINIWEVVFSDQTIDQKRLEHKTNINRCLALILIRQDIRNKIARNNQAQVNQLITQRKILLDKLGVYRSIIQQIDLSAVQTATAFDGKMISLKANTGTYRPVDILTIGLMDSEEIDSMNNNINSLQRQVELVEDQLTTANSSSTLLVILDQDSYTTLRNENIIL